MNYKDKEEFDEWRNSTSTRLDIHDAWQAACEYKQKEYSNLMDAMTQTSQYNFKLQAENKKLREALEFYANNQITMTTENGVYLRDGLNGNFFPLKEKARKALKEVEKE